MGKKSLVFLFILMLSVTCSAGEISRIVAKVNNIIITSKDLDDYSNMLAYRAALETNTLPQLNQGFKKKALQKLIEDKLILSEAKREEIELSDPHSVEDKVKEIISSYPTIEEFEQSLIERGLTVTLLKERLKEQFLIREMINRNVRSFIYILPQEINEYYQQNQNFFSQPTRYHIAIITADDDGYLDQAAQVLQGQGIEAAQKEYEDSLVIMESSAAELRPEIVEALTPLSEGQYTITLFDNRKHLIFLEKILPAHAQTLTQSASTIQTIISQKKFETRYEEWLNDLRDNAVIKVYAPYNE